MKIRKFRKQDAKKVSNMIRKTLMEVNIRDSPRFAVEELYGEYSPKELVKLSKEREIYLVIEKDKIIGTGGLENNYICTVFVHPDYRGKGIGKIIMDYLENKIKSKKYSFAELNSGPTALTFYKKLGYKKIKETFVKGKKTSILMRKRIK
ncbi:GNAT family N-acetyltransferase [Candidatus Woesearchaeota archaeon]|nr:GNAT family N-acetyltransferase [Candidatus Woesearchaeota archaeon]